MQYPFRNLIFEGGGVKGIAYVGAMEALHNHGILPGIARVGGTSAGAINATLSALGYSTEETLETIWNLNFRDLLDDSWGLVRDTKRLVKEFGWYRGDYFRSWIGNRIAQKTGNPHTTFRDHAAAVDAGKGRQLYLVGTNISTGFAEILSAEHTPRVCIADAVRISMSLPLFFATTRSIRGDVYVDGGLVDNYPVKLFDRERYVSRDHSVETEYYRRHNESIPGRKDRQIDRYLYNQETLGFRLDSAKEIAVFRDQAEPQAESIEDFFDFSGALLKTLLNIQSSMHLHGDDWHRTIYIDTLGVGTTQFDLDDETKDRLIESGRQHTDTYLEWFLSSEGEVHNRPTA